MSYRIVCASDGHGARSAREALVRQMPACDLFCYLGDVESDALYFRAALAQVRPAAAFLAVAGNCDPFFGACVNGAPSGRRACGCWRRTGICFPSSRRLTCWPRLRWITGACWRCLAIRTSPAANGREACCCLIPGALRQGQWGVVEIGEKGGN